MNIIIGKLEHVVVEEDSEHILRIFEVKTDDARRETEGFNTFKLPANSTGVIGAVLGDAGSLILHDRLGRPHPATVRVGEDGRYRFAFPPSDHGWIKTLNEDGYRGRQQNWEIWLLKKRSAGHFRAVSLRPHSSRATRIPQPRVASEDNPAAAEEEEDPAAGEEEDEEDDE